MNDINHLPELKPTSFPQLLSNLVDQAAGAKEMESFLKHSLNALLRFFGFIYARTYLVDTLNNGAGETASLRQVIGYLDASLMSQLEGSEIRLNAETSVSSPLAKAITTRKPQFETLTSNGNGMPAGMGKVEQIRRAVFPLALRGRAIGAMDFFFSSTAGSGEDKAPESKLDEEFVEKLRLCTQQISLGISSLVKITEGEGQGLETELLYKTSLQITQASDLQQIISIISQVLKNVPYQSMLVLGAGESMHIMHSNPVPADLDIITQTNAWNLQRYPKLSLPRKVAYSYFPSSKPVIVDNLDACNLPRPIVELPSKLRLGSAVFLPVVRENNLSALLIIGKPDQPASEYASEPTLTPFISLIELVVNSVDKLQSQVETQRRLKEMETLWTVSQAISLESDLTSLYTTIHEQVVQVMGDMSSFAIVLYDAQSGKIRIPYMIEEDKFLTIPPFPLGEGLSSIVLRSGKPLLLVEDTENQARALGAKIVGAPAKSWLGVPLMHAGETFGLVIVQDINREHRFNEDDQRLLSMLANQIAVVVRNTRLLEISKTQAEYERLANEIVNKIRGSSDMHTILKTAAEELAQSLGAYRTKIKIGVQAGESPGGNGSSSNS